MLKLKIAVAGRKGGVGKTTVSCGIGSIFAAQGKKTLVVDLDPQSNVAFGLGISPHLPGTAEAILSKHVDPIEVLQNLHVLPGGPLLEDHKISALDVADFSDNMNDFDYDVAIFDCPPGHENLERFALATAQIALVVLDAHLFGIMGARRVVDILQSRRAKGRTGVQNWALVKSRIDTRRKADAMLESNLQKFFPDTPQLLVHQDMPLANASMEGIPITKYAPGAKSVIDLWEISRWANQ